MKIRTTTDHLIGKKVTCTLYPKEGSGLDIKPIEFTDTISTVKERYWDNSTYGVSFENTHNGVICTMEDINALLRNGERRLTDKNGEVLNIKLTIVRGDY